MQTLHLVSQSSGLTMQLGKHINFIDLTPRCSRYECLIMWDVYVRICGCLKMDVPFMCMNHSDGFRIVTSFTELDVHHVHENSSPNYSRLFIISSRWYIVQGLGQIESCLDHIPLLPTSYVLPVSSGRSLIYMPAVYIYIANQPKLWNVWGRGHERTVFWQLVSAYFRQPGGRHAGESLEVRSAEHWCNSRNRFAVPFVGNCCEFILVLFFFHPYIQEFLTIGWTGLLRKLGTHLFNWKFLRFLRYYMTSLSFSTNAPTHHVPLYTSLQRIPKYLPLASFPSHICTKFSCDSNARIPWITSAWPTTALSGPHFAAAERRIRWIWMLGWVFWNKCFHVHPYSRNFLPGVLLCTTHVFTLVATN